MLPTAMVPLPVALCSRLGCDTVGAALALGTKLQDASAFFLAGAFCSDPPVICSNSATLILSAVSAKVSLGAWKFAMLRLPPALVEPRDAAKFVRLTEFCVNCMLALRICNGLVSEGIFNDAFCSAPEPLKFMASVFLMGPEARTSRLMLPLPLMPSTALTPYALAMPSNSSTLPFTVLMVASTVGEFPAYCESVICAAKVVAPEVAVNWFD